MKKHDLQLCPAKLCVVLGIAGLPEAGLAPTLSHMHWVMQHMQQLPAPA